MIYYSGSRTLFWGVGRLLLGNIDLSFICILTHPCINRNQRFQLNVPSLWKKEGGHVSDVDKNMYYKYSILSSTSLTCPPSFFQRERDVQLKSLISIDTGMGQNTYER